MKVKKIVVAFIVLVAVFFVIIWLNKKTKRVELLDGEVTPSITQQIENKFSNINIPDDAEKIELKDVSGGLSMGLATRTEILADLPEISSGSKYQAWLGNGTKEILLGTLIEKKGGWMIEYDSSKFPGYNKVSVKEGTKVILEGSF